MEMQKMGFDKSMGQARDDLYNDFIDKEVVDDSELVNQTCYGDYRHCLGNCFGFFRVWIPCCCCVDNPYREVKQSTVGLVENWGVYQRTKKPGLVWVNPCTERMIDIDLKTRVCPLDGLEIITQDDILCNCDGSVYYRVVNPRIAYYRLEQLEFCVEQVTSAALRNICGEKEFQDLIKDKKEIADSLQKQIMHQVKDWGVVVDIVFLKDMQIHRKIGSIKEDLAEAAKQKRISEAKIISAQADVEAAQLMRQSAELLNTPAAMQIRYLETLSKIADSNNSRVIFIPQDEDKLEFNHKITQGLLNR